MIDKVLITGATGLLGQAITAQYSDVHAELALQYRTDKGMAERLVAAATKSGAKAVAIQQDFESLTDADREIAHFCAHVDNEIGVPNIAILNAAAQEVTTWDELTAADWDHQYHASFRPTALLTHRLGWEMSRTTVSNRCIVLIGSIEGIRPASGHAPYATMKAALHHLVAAAAHELGPKGVRVVGVAPGLIDREGLKVEWPQGVDRYRRAAALGRSVTADEVAQVVHFLASSAASAITGVTLPVDAGWSAHPGW